MATLIEELGGRLSIIPGNSVAAAIIEYARQHNVTKIVVGKTLRTKWQELLHNSILNRMIFLSGDIDIYVVSTERELPVKKSPRPQHITDWKNYFWGLLATMIATALCSLIHVYIDPTNLVMIYLRRCSLRCLPGRGPSIWSPSSAFSSSILYVPPPTPLFMSDTIYFDILGLIGVASISELPAGTRSGRRQRREADTATLNPSVAIFRSSTSDESFMRDP